MLVPPRRNTLSNTVSGIVQSIDARETKFGQMYSARVNGTSYGIGKYPPKCKVGDNVTFNVTYNGQYANMDTKSLQVIAGGATAPSAPPAAGAPTRGNYEDPKQTVIAKQSALNSAVAFMQVLQSADALPVSKTAKPADRLKTLEAMLNHYRSKFYFESTGSEFPVVEKDEPTIGDADSDADEEEDSRW